MKIRKIISQHRRDFRAIYECEYCGFETEGTGYDDNHFHRNVIPEMKCIACGKKADATSYRPLAPKYSESMTV